MPRSPAAGSDDVGRVHHGGRPAGRGARRRVGNPSRHGRRGVLRDARRHRVRPCADTRLLRHRRSHHRMAGTPASGFRGGDDDCSRGRSLIMEEVFTTPTVTRLRESVAVLEDRLPESDRRNRPAGRHVAALAVLAATALLSACSLRAPYQAPPTAAVALPEAQTAAFSTNHYDPLWWRLFDDPVLEQLEQQALEANHDIRAAVARIDQARAALRDAELDRYPVGAVGASVDVRSQTIPGFS